jgi:toxin ParE1/3/4
MKDATIHRRAGAKLDLVEAYRFYAREAGMKVADRFLVEAEATFKQLAAMPGIGTRFEASNPAFGELRFLPLPARFKKFSVFYRAAADGIEIIRVLHGARDIAGILAEDFDLGDDEGEERGHS